MGHSSDAADHISGAVNWAWESLKSKIAKHTGQQVHFFADKYMYEIFNFFLLLDVSITQLQCTSC
jgi:hypothetical protein